MSPRPTFHTQSVIDRVIEELTPKLVVWCEGESCAEDIKRDLAKVLQFFTHSDDGYSIAKDLDRAGWMPNSDLVEICDSAPIYFRSALSAAEKLWVAENGLSGPEIGSLVLWKNGRITEPGEVTRNEPDGKSYVHFPGHPKSSAYIIEWERLEPTLTRKEMEAK